MKIFNAVRVHARIQWKRKIKHLKYYNTYYEIQFRLKATALRYIYLFIHFSFILFRTA